MPTRLDSVDKELSSRLAAAFPDQQRAAVAAAVDLAVTTTQLDGDQVANALAVIEDRRADAELHRQLTALAADLDERAFDLQDQADDNPDRYPEYEAAFARARAAAAIGYALSEDASMAAIEGVYEAHAAVGDIDRVRRVVDPALS